MQNATKHNALAQFHPAIRNWFSNQFEAPTPPQIMGWPAIHQRENVLILAPTGSGKTLAAFLECLNQLLVKLTETGDFNHVDILYISPMKALNYDIERNLEAPLKGIRAEAEKTGLVLPAIRVAVRTGDTPQKERQRMLRQAPHILITTPESLHLILTSTRARSMLNHVRFVIVDEIHALSANKRGTFLMLLLERLQHQVRHPFTRIGLSATQKPLDKIAEFLGGYQYLNLTKNPSGPVEFQQRPVHIIDAGMRKEMDLQILSPVPDMASLPDMSIWPSIYETLLKQVEQHNSTLIFANNRATVERITANINELAGERIARAHHGSVSKEIRQEIELKLKAGELPCLVATATMELGIDMGAIDLVCQVESPYSVASGLQRVGRAGHLFGAKSKGRLLPKMRSDLLQMAATARSMSRGDVAPIKIPQNCLDVLAQQIVAMVAIQTWPVEDLFNTIRQAAPYQKLPRSQYLNVLEMLSGRYSVEAFRNLKPRISWDRVNQKLLALPGSQRTVLLNGGAIPETGQYPVYLESGFVKLGELEEEFVYEARLGDNFQLGTNTWKITAIEANRIIVRSAQGQPAKVPFWKGGIDGRDPELGRQIGAFSREFKQQLNSPTAAEWLQKECFLDPEAAENLTRFFQQQLQKGGFIPDDKTIVIESFRDEMGDPRVVLLSPYGRRVHYAWRLALVAEMRQRLNIELETIDSDSGILFRFSGVSPQAIIEIIQQTNHHQIRELVTKEIANSALFGLRFRYNAGRALLLPRQLPGKRTPLWLLRMRSRDLLEIVRQYDSFPIVVETYRELLQDFLALDELKTILSGIEKGSIQLKVVEKNFASPFCSALLFDFTAGYMYEYDTPKMSPQNAVTGISDEALADLLPQENIGHLLDYIVIDEMDSRLQGRYPGYQARSPQELFELLRRLGDLSTDEITARCEIDADTVIEQLAAEHQICQIAIPGAQPDRRWIPLESVSLYATAFQLEKVSFENTKNLTWENIETVLPVGMAKSLTIEDAGSQIVHRYFVNHSLVSVETLRQRYPLSLEWIQGWLDNQKTGRLLTAVPNPDKTDVFQWILNDKLEQLRRATLRRQREQIKPVTPAMYSLFLLEWQHVANQNHLNGEDGLFSVLEQLQGLALPASVLEYDILAPRLTDYQSGWLDALINSGEILWQGQTNQRLQFVLREDVSLFRHPETGEEDELSPKQEKIISFLQDQGASFVHEIATETGQTTAECNSRLWELIWTGHLTNDTYRIIRNGKPPDPALPGSRKTRVHGMMRQAQFNTAGRRRTGGGRWTLLSAAAKSENTKISEVNTKSQTSTVETLEAIVWQLLFRYGLLCREIYDMESLSIPWRSVYQMLVRFEWRGEIRRGYFVSGFSGMQFAIPAAAEKIEQFSQPTSKATSLPEFVLINSCDPANIFGAGAPQSIRHSENADWSFRRSQGNYLIFNNGEPVIAIENRGQRLTPLMDLSSTDYQLALNKIPLLLRNPGIRSIKIETWNNTPVRNTFAATLLKEIGFRDEFKQMILERSF